MSRQRFGRWRACAGIAMPLAMMGALSSCGDSDTALPFGLPVASELGGSPRSLRWGDFDGDGRMDLAFVMDGGAWVALGNGDGTLRPPKSIGGFGNAQSLAAGDLTADGRLDLAVLDCPAAQCAAGAVLFTVRGLGDGNFQPPVASPYVTDALAVAVGDLDGDGYADVVAIRSNSTVSTLLGNGDGTLRPPTDFPTLPYATTLSAGWVEVADANGDGRPDVLAFLATSFLTGSIEHLAGRGDGTLAPTVRTDLAFSPTRYAITDFDRGGRLDAALLGNRFRGPYPLAVRAGQADGSFGPELRIECPGPADTYVICTSFSVGDFDGDGIPDIAQVASFGEPLGGALLLVPGKGDGTFAQASGIDPAPAAGEALDASADLNGDGRADLVFVSPSGVTVRLAVR